MNHLSHLSQHIARSPHRIFRQTRLTCRLCVALFGASAVLLGACSRPPETAPTTATNPAYVAMARGRIDVEGGVQRIAAPRDGVLAKLNVDVGDNVRAGQALALLETRQAELALALAQAEAAQAQAQAGAQQVRLPALTARAERLKQAVAAGAASGQTADDAELAVAELKADLLVSAASVGTAQRKLAQALEAVQASTVLAPVGGRVLERLVRTGENLSAHTPLFTLRPARPLVVRAELNEAVVDRVKVGMRAEVVSVNDETTVYPAQVLRIGEMFAATRLAEVPNETVDSRSVECLLRLDTDKLRIGLPVLVRFLP
ncbi:MAG: HlyD family efflux transporter periplasmic adaptor subunit [Sterolibacterium sp.]